MGRNKFSASEIENIRRLLNKKNSSNRYRQKQIRHILRVEYGFQISDFNIQGKAFGEADLNEAIRRGRIAVLDDATIEEMKKRYRENKEKDSQYYNVQDNDEK